MGLRVCFVQNLEQGLVPRRCSTRGSNKRIAVSLCAWVCADAGMGWGGVSGTRSRLSHNRTHVRIRHPASREGRDPPNIKPRSCARGCGHVNHIGTETQMNGVRGWARQAFTARAFQAEGTVCAKVPGHRGARHIAGAVRRHVWPEQSGPGGEREEGRAGTGRGAVSAGPGGRGEDLGFSCVDRPVWWGGLGLGQGAKGGCSGEGGVRVRLTNMAGACLGGRGRRGGGTKARVACAARPSRTGKAEPRLANV